MDIRNWYRADLGEIAVHKAWNLESTGLVTHGFTTRGGGVSPPPRDTLNLALHVSDLPACVMENRVRLFDALGFDPSALTCAEQVHGNGVAVVTADHTGRGAAAFKESIPGVDALITDARGPVLALFYADCVPVYILDPKRPAVGLAHAGWRGTAAGIAKETVSAMSREFGTNPGECLAAIGPAIGRCCYDVSTDVAEKIYDVAQDDRVVACLSEGGCRADLKLANWLVLRDCGVPEQNIAMSRNCSACEAEDFFSHRRDGPTGRMAAVLALR